MLLGRVLVALAALGTSSAAPQRGVDASSLLEPWPHGGGEGQLGGGALLQGGGSHLRCPKRMGGLLFNHISKTGGTSFKFLLEGILKKNGPLKGTDASHALAPWPPHNVQQRLGFADGLAGTGEDDARYTGHGIVTQAHADNYFVIGLIRAPCDFVLSTYLQTINSAKTHRIWNPSNPKNLTKWFNGRSQSQDKKGNTMAQLYAHVDELDLVHERYGNPNKVHCMVTTNNMHEGLYRCLQQFKACGTCGSRSPHGFEAAHHAVRPPGQRVRRL